MDVEERNRQIKMKINKYKQATGSDSRLEKDFNSKVKKSFSKIRSRQVLLHKTIQQKKSTSARLIWFSKSPVRRLPLTPPDDKSSDDTISCPCDILTWCHQEKTSPHFSWWHHVRVSQGQEMWVNTPRENITKTTSQTCLRIRLPSRSSENTMWLIY